jgi:hypothetical protein
MIGRILRMVKFLVINKDDKERMVWMKRPLKNGKDVNDGMDSKEHIPC